MIDDAVTVIDRRRSTYPPTSVGIGIVHLGLGAFHRAHQASTIEAGLNRHGGGAWGICAANIRSNDRIVNALNAQGGRYHVVEWHDRTHCRITEIRAIRNALFARDDPAPLLAQMTAPATRIVSLTVSEKAYGLDPVSGTLNTDEPAIAHDCRAPARPRSVPGLLVAALERRRALGLPPFTVLCCDNMPDNGNRTRAAVAALARLRVPALADWIESSVAFPGTMVDRIVPAVSIDALERLAALIGEPDAAAVSCEAFSQWVVEDRFSAGRPDWEADGVEMVAAVAPFESMKYRLLNGAHSLLAYAGLLRGRSTVAEAIVDPAIASAVESFWAEASLSLMPNPAADLVRYTAKLRERFRNDALDHRLRQIAMDGSQKLPQRWLTGASINSARGAPVGATAAAVAAWMAYVRGVDSQGNRYRVDDPMADRLAACHARHPSPDDAPLALLAIREIFAPDLAGSPTFRDAVCSAYRKLVGPADRA